MSIDIERNYAEFKKYLKAYITRDGIDNFIKWLDGTDFKTAPASAKYNLNVEGGLCKHSLDTFLMLIKLCNATDTLKIYSKESIALVSLLHDIGKVGMYCKEKKNVKVDGKWVEQEVWGYNDATSWDYFGDSAENSLYIIGKFFKLNRSEELAIRFHNGAFDAKEPAKVSHMYSICAFATLLHSAELISTYVTECDTSTMPLCDLNVEMSQAEEVPEETVVETKPEERKVEDDKQNNTATTEFIDDCPF